MSFITKLNKQSIITTLFFIGIFVFSFMLLDNNVLCGDDILFDFISNGIQIHLPNIGYGTWVLQLEDQLMFYLPHELGINIQDWALIFGGFIKALTVTGFAFFFYKFMQIEKISIAINMLLTFIFYSVFVISITNSAISDFTIYHGFFRFVFSSLLMLIFIYMYYKYLIYKEVNLWIIIPFAIITAASSEVIAGILLSLVFLCAIINFIYGKIYNNNFDKSQFYIFLALLTGTILLVTNEGFYEHFGGKALLYSINDYINMLLPFFKLYAKVIIKNYIWVYLICLFSYLMLIPKIKQDKLTVLKIFFSIFCISAVWIFAFSLITMGPNSRRGNFWIDHPDLYTIYIFVFITAILIPVSCVIKQYYKKLKIVFFLITFAIITILIPNIKNTYTTLNNILDKLKYISYMRDKVMVFGFYNNFLLADSDLFDYMVTYYDDRLEEFEIKNIVNEKIKDVEFYIEVLENDYIPIVYNVKCENPTIIKGIITLKDTLQYVKSKGFEYDEVKTGKYKFSDISNREFVLGKTKK